MTAHRNGKRNGADSRHAAKVDAAAQSAFVQALVDAGISDDRAAKEMGVHRSMVRRYVSGEVPVNPRYPSRSETLWRHFHACYRRELSKVYAARRRTLPHLARKRRACS